MMKRFGISPHHTKEEIPQSVIFSFSLSSPSLSSHISLSSSCGDLLGELRELE